MNHYQGENTDFKLELKPTTGDGSQITEYSQLSNIILYFYTDTHIAKFSNIQADGYESMTNIGDTILTGTIKSIDTSLMCGALKVDILCKNGDENIIEAGKLTGISILKSKIKESTNV